ncbi:dipicolinate synthase subunit B, partial [Bacillus atrophaeus]|nr:dipicolinate synthase subunit B [Bacillus atrophaeus]
NGTNLMRLMSTKNIFFIPFGQDDPYKKPNSMVAKMELLPQTVEKALSHQQLQPILVENYQGND